MSTKVMAALLLGAATSALAGDKPLQIRGFSPRQLPRGLSTTIEFVGEKILSVERVDISPADGLTVQDVRPGPATEYQRKKGITPWRLTIAVSADAQPGERHLVVRTPGGISTPEVVVIPSHLPVISDLKILSATSAGTSIELEFVVDDEAGDIATAAIHWGVECRDSRFETGSTSRNFLYEFTPPDPKHFLLKRSLTNPTATTSGTCGLSVWFSDKNGYESNKLSASVTFQ